MNRSNLRKREFLLASRGTKPTAAGKVQPQTGMVMGTEPGNHIFTHTQELEREEMKVGSGYKISKPASSDVFPLMRLCFNGFMTSLNSATNWRPSLLAIVLMSSKP